jgi:hypothetical protein
MEPDKSCISIEDDGQSCPSPNKTRWVAQRAPDKPGDRMLSLEAVAWLDSLPQDVRPHNLAKRYPRICNRMVERWKFPELMIPYFDELLMDSRGGRQGFPMMIAIEIVSLKEHFLAILSSSKADVWDRNIASRDF